MEDSKNLKTIVRPPVYNMAKAGAFELDINPQSELKEVDIIAQWISLPTYNAITKSFEDFTITIDGELIVKNFYYGKPTQITNILSWEDIQNLIEDYNNENVDYMTIKEFDENNELRTETKYYDPKIISASMGNYMKDSKENKTLTFTFAFSNFNNYYITNTK